MADLLIFPGDRVGAGPAASLQLLLVVGELEALLLQVADAFLQVLVLPGDYVGRVACRPLSRLQAGAAGVWPQAALMAARAALQLDLLSGPDDGGLRAISS